MKIALGLMMAFALVLGGVVITTSDESDAAADVSASVSYSQDNGLTISFTGVDDGLDVLVTITGAINDGLSGTVTDGQFQKALNVSPVAGNWNLYITVMTEYGIPAYDEMKTMSVVSLTYVLEPGSETTVSEFYSIGQQIILKSPTDLGFSKSGYTFGGWMISGSTLASGETLQIDGSKNASGIWTQTPTSHKVTVPSSDQYTTDVSAGIYSVEDRSNFVFKVIVNDAYSQRTPTVRANGTPIDPIDPTPSGGQIYNFVIRNVTEDVDITVDSMDLNVYTVTIPTSTEGYVIELIDSVDVKYGESFRFKVTLSTGYVGTSITVKTDDDTTLVPVNDVYTVVDITSDVVISVTVNSYPVSIPSGEGYVVGGELTAIPGQEYRFTVGLEEGYTNSIPQVTVNGTALSSVVYDPVEHKYTYAVEDVTGPLTIDVTGVGKNKYTVTLDSGPNGTISSETPITGQIEHGSTVVIIVSPNTGYYLSTLRVNDGDDVSEDVIDGRYSLYVDGDKTVRATFTNESYSIRIIVGSGGEVTPNGTIEAVYGSSKTFTITADGDKVIDRVLIDGVAVGGMGGKAYATYTLSNITSTHTVEVGFKIAETYSVTLDFNDRYGDAYVIGLTEGGMMLEGRATVLVVDPVFGFKANVQVNGNTVELDDDGMYVLPMEDVDITVTFLLMDDDEDDGPITPVTPGTPETPASDDSDDGDNITIIAIAAAAVAAVVAALALVALRKD